MDPNKICVGCMEDDSGDPLCPKCGRPFGLEPKNPLQMKPRTLLRDQYLIGRALGHGGFGITYIAWDTGLESRLAIKEYMPSGVGGRASGDSKVMAYSEHTCQEFEWGLDRFLEEARLLKKFSNHPNIVSVDTIFRDNGTAYLVMEYLDGLTFEEFLARRGGSVTFETALRVMLPVMDALITVHSESILHRDISPDNIHLTRNGRIKLIDFGAARNALSQKSRNLSIILKEGYAPEEQYRASGIQGPWTDVYATAATLYHALTGKIPQPALDRQAGDEVELPSKMSVRIDTHAEAALMKALAVKAPDRFQSMEDFKSALTGSIDVPGPYVPQPLMPDLAPRSFAPPPLPPQPQPGFAAPPQYAYPPPPPAPILVRPGRPGWMVPGILAAVAVVAVAAVLIVKPTPVIDDGGKREKGGGQQQGGGVQQQGGGGAQQQGGGGQQQTGGGGEQQGGAGQEQSGGGGQQQSGGTGQQQGAGTGRQQAGGGGQQQSGGGQQKGGGGQQQKGGGDSQQPGGGGGPQQSGGGQEQAGGGGQQESTGGGQQQSGGQEQSSGVQQQGNQQAGGSYNSSGSVAASGYDGLLQQAKQVSQRNPNQAIQLLNLAVQMDPSRPQAHNFLGEIELYTTRQLGPAVQNYKAALERGGEATFHVFHDHGGTGFSRSCTGWLFVSKRGVRFEAFDSLHKFQATSREIYEAKRNRFGGGQVGPIRIGGGNGGTTTDVNAFHIRLHNSKGENYNLAPMSNYKEAERDLILEIIGKG